MSTVYACTYVHKTAEVDDFENGCDLDSTVCILAEPCSIRASSLSGLIEAIGDAYYLDIDDVFIADDDEDGVHRIGYNRLETNDCNEPTEHQMVLWRQGSLTLYLCDYYFVIEKRTVEPIKLEEFKQAGIKFHQ